MSLQHSTISEKDALIQRWLDSKDALEKSKELENQLRLQVLEACIENVPEKGTINYELGNGYKLKFEFRQNVRLDQSKVDDVIDKLERIGQDGKFIADRLFKMKAELSITEYNQLNDKMRKLVDNIITKSPATPALTFIPPKNT